VGSPLCIMKFPLSERRVGSDMNVAVNFPTEAGATDVEKALCIAAAAIFVSLSCIFPIKTLLTILMMIV